MRPALMFGVPMLPFMLVAMPMVIFIVSISFWFMALFALVHWIMAFKTKQDELYFDLLFLRLSTFFMTRKFNSTANGHKIFMATTTALRSREVSRDH